MPLILNTTQAVVDPVEKLEFELSMVRELITNEINNDLPCFTSLNKYIKELERIHNDLANPDINPNIINPFER